MLTKLQSIAAGAGSEILKYYDNTGQVFNKADESPLTAADLAAHRYICNELITAFPEIPICSEEGIENGSPLSAERFWLVDPLDGTKEFLKRTGHFTVNIALIEKDSPVIGVIHVPTTGECYMGAVGRGAWKICSAGIHSRINVSSANNPPRFVASRDHAGPTVEQMIVGFPGAECLSIGSSLKFCLIAEGAADIYLRDIPTMEWDTAAAHAILKEAGGEVYTWPMFVPLTYGKKEYRNGSLISVADPSLRETIECISKGFC